MIVALVFALLLDQAPQTPVRDRPNAEPGEPTAQISGRVITADNAPLRRAVVRLTSPSLAAARVVRSDLSGRYAFTALPPGRFTLRASKAGHLSLEFGQRRPFEQGRRIDIKAGEALRGVDVMLPKAAAISGVVMDDAGEPVQQMWVAAARSGFRDGRRTMISVVQTVTNDIGEFRLAGLAPGDYYVVAKERDARMNEFADEPLGFATTFHPGTAILSEAQPFRVALGQEIVNVTLPLTAARTITVTGRVVDLSGAPVPLVRVSLGETLASFVGGGIGGGASADAGGRFRIAGIRPGRYILSARDRGLDGELPLETAGVDVNGLQIVIGPGAKVAGRLVGETGGPLPSTAGIELRANAPAETQQSGTPAARILAGGAFEWPALMGEYVLRATRLPPGLWLKAIMRGDADVTDAAIAVTHDAKTDNLTVVLADGAAALSGSATSKDGKAETDYTVILFPEDRASETALSRLVRADRPDHKGSYRIAGIPPGTWLVAAVDFVEDGQWLDPSYLESLRPLAAKVTLDRRDDKTLNLELKR